MVVNSVPSSPATPTGAVNSSGDSVGPIDRHYSFNSRPYPFLYTMYSPSFNPYSSYGPSHPSGSGSAPGPPSSYPYPVYSAADTSQGYGTKYGPPSSGSGYGGGSGHGTSYGPPAPPSGGYEYHPAPHPHPPPHPPPHPAPHPISYHVPSSPKSKKGKGAALSAMTLLAFLYFLNMLQSCLKEHMETMNPTVMVMTAGATRRKDIGEILMTDKEQMLGEYEAVDGYEAADDRYHLLTISGNQSQGGQSFFGGGKKYKFRKATGAGQRIREVNGEVVYYDDY